MKENQEEEQRVRVVTRVVHEVEEAVACENHYDGGLADTCVSIILSHDKPQQLPHLNQGEHQHINNPESFVLDFYCDCG